VAASQTSVATKCSRLIGSSGVVSIHAVRPSWMPRNVATNTHAASSNARASEAFMNRPATITAITIRRAGG
jgi:hypothetical protein